MRCTVAVGTERDRVGNSVLSANREWYTVMDFEVRCAIGATYKWGRAHATLTLPLCLEEHLGYNVRVSGEHRCYHCSSLRKCGREFQPLSSSGTGQLGGGCDIALELCLEDGERFGAGMIVRDGVNVDRTNVATDICTGAKLQPQRTIIDLVSVCGDIEDIRETAPGRMDVLQYADHWKPALDGKLNSVPVCDRGLPGGVRWGFCYSIPKRAIGGVLANRPFGWSSVPSFIQRTVEIPNRCDETAGLSCTR